MQWERTRSHLFLVPLQRCIWWNRILVSLLHFLFLLLFFELRHPPLIVHRRQNLSIHSSPLDFTPFLSLPNSLVLYPFSLIRPDSDLERSWGGTLQLLLFLFSSVSFLFLTQALYICHIIKKKIMLITINVLLPNPLVPFVCVFVILRHLRILHLILADNAPLDSGLVDIITITPGTPNRKGRLSIISGTFFWILFYLFISYFFLNEIEF